jgi:hypothetical protein
VASVLDFIWTPGFLGITGGILEVAGLTHAIHVAARERRQRFGILSWPRALVAWVRFWLGPPASPVIVQAGGGSARASGGGSVSVIGQETDIERLTREVRELRARQTAHDRAVADHLDETNRRVNDIAADLDQQVSKIVTDDQRDRRAALRREILGARVFMVGAILSALANVAPN